MFFDILSITNTINNRIVCYTKAKCEYFCTINLSINRKHHLRHMKKIAAFLATVVILTILLSSCGSSEKCAAYGEYKDYKVETR
jgi:hypothetical protein